MKPTLIYTIAGVERLSRERIGRFWRGESLDREADEGDANEGFAMAGILLVVAHEAALLDQPA